MRPEFLPFSRPNISEEDIEAVVKVMRSKWLTTGKECAKFEREFAEHVGGREAVAVASATGGMHCALKALDIGPGDEVVTPSMTWVSTPNLIELAGATPVWVDVDRDNLMTSAALVEPLITPRTKAIIPVHFAGAPVDLDPLRELAARKGVFLLEDAAHAIGTAYKGNAIGSRGSAIFSFHPIKNITTSEGGLLVSDNRDFAARVRRLKFHGLGVDAYDRETLGRKPQAEVVEPGYKYNLTDMAAALGRTQLAKLEEMNLAREELAGRYARHFASVPEILPLVVPPWPHRHSWHLYVVRLDKEGLTRDVYMERLKRRNIGTGIHFLAAHTHAHYRHKPGPKPVLPNSEWNSRRLFSIPLFPGMTPEDIDDVVAAMREALVRE